MTACTDLPDDPTALAMIVQDNTQPLERRNAAWQKLQPIIEGLARRIAQCWAISKQLWEEFVDSAASYVWQRLSYFNPAHGTLHSWCLAVLRNCLVDLLRQKKRDPAKLASDVEQRDDSEQEDRIPGEELFQDKTDWRSVVEKALDRRELFGSADLRSIRSWPLRVRIVLLTLSGLWIKVPVDEWAGWVREFGLEEPFPPREVTECDDHCERTALLAELWNMPRNTLAQRWHRGKQLLVQLDYIRDLRSEG